MLHHCFRIASSGFALRSTVSTFETTQVSFMPKQPLLARLAPRQPFEIPHAVLTGFTFFGAFTQAVRETLGHAMQSSLQAGRPSRPRGNGRSRTLPFCHYALELICAAPAKLLLAHYNRGIPANPTLATQLIRLCDLDLTSPQACTYTIPRLARLQLTAACMQAPSLSPCCVAQYQTQSQTLSLAVPE